MKLRIMNIQDISSGYCTQMCCTYFRLVWYLVLLVNNPKLPAKRLNLKQKHWNITVSKKKKKTILNINNFKNIYLFQIQSLLLNSNYFPLLYSIFVQKKFSKNLFLLNFYQCLIILSFITQISKILFMFLYIFHSPWKNYTQEQMSWEFYWL